MFDRLDRPEPTFLRGKLLCEEVDELYYQTKIKTVCLFSVKTVDRTVACIVNKDSQYKSMLIIISCENVTLFLEMVPGEPKS